MSQTKSPDGTFPDFPFQLGTNGQFITEDDLCTSTTTGKGWIGKLVDAVGWLKDRAGYTALISTDGAGGCTIEWQSGSTSGADWISTVLDDTTNGIIVTLATTYASVNDFSVEATVQRRSDEATLASKRYAVVEQTVAVPVEKFEIQVVDDGGNAINVSTSAVRVFVRLTDEATL